MQIFYGKDEALVEHEARTAFPTARFVRAHGDLAQALQDACSSSLLADDSPCIVAGCGFLTSAVVSKSDKAAVAMLADMDASKLVMLAEGDKLTSEPTIAKLVIKKAKAKKVAALTERTMAGRIVAGAAERKFALSEDAVALLAKRLPANWGIISSELDKIKNLNLPSVSAASVAELVSSYADETVLDWVDAMVNGDGKKAISLYRAIKRNGVDEGEMIGILAGQLVFIKNAVMAYRKIPTANHVAGDLGVSPFRVAMNWDLIATASQSRIDGVIDLTYAYDMAIKEGSLSKGAAVQALIMEAGAYGRKH